MRMNSRHAIQSGKVEPIQGQALGVNESIFLCYIYIELYIVFLIRTSALPP